MNKLTVIFLCLVVGLGSAILGYSAGKITSPVQNSNSSLLNQIANLPEGAEITISEEELEKCINEKEYNGATSEKSYFRMFSWAGVGGPEAAMGDQGITTDDMKIGASKSQSWITGLWKFIKSVFWFLVLYFAVWLILSALSLVYPPLGIIATIMATIATGGLAGISAVFNWIKGKATKTALKQTVAGVDAYKTANPESKIALNSQLKMAQDSNSKDVVDAIRK